MKISHISVAILFASSLSIAFAALAEESSGPASFEIVSILYPKVFPLGEEAQIRINVTTPQDLPNGSYIIMNSTDPDGVLVQTKVPLRPGQYEYDLPLQFDAPGKHGMIIGFETDGGFTEADSFECLAVEASSYWNWDSMEGWTFHGSDPGFKAASGDVRSPGGGGSLSLGAMSGGTFVRGFTGETYAHAQSPLFDLTNATKATVYFYHQRSFQGPLGSCGGIVQVLSGDNVTSITPESGYDARLKENVSGNLGGEWAFSGEEDWSLSTIDLGAFLGSEIGVRFCAASDDEGSGNWSVDDIFTVVEGPTDDDPPGMVRELESTVNEDGTVLVSWSPPSDPDVAGYNIYLSETEINEVSDEVPFDTILTDVGNEYLFTGLKKGQIYWVAVTAFDDSGNQRTDLDGVSFIIEESGPNKPPVAVIRVQSQAPFRAGTEIELDAKGSHDPDHDDLTYSWILSDGTKRIGDEIKWKPSVSGTAVVRLEARDVWGATNETFVKLEVEAPVSKNPIDKGDLATFLTFVIPAAMMMLMVLAIVAVVRTRKRRKLELDLEEVGIVHRPQFGTECKPAPPGKKVLDLVPVGKRSEPPSQTRQIARNKPPTRELRIPPPPEPPAVPKQPDQVRSGDPAPQVNVTLECPCCGKSFRQRMGKRALKEGNISVRCPHCGSEGAI